MTNVREIKIALSPADAKQCLDGIARSLGDIERAAAKPLGAIQSVQGAFDRVRQSFSSIKSLADKVGVGFLTEELVNSLALSADLERQQKRLVLQIQATSGEAGLSAKQILQFSQNLAQQTLASKAEVNAAAAALLEFKAVSGEAFKDTLALAQDLAANGFGDLKSNATLLAQAIKEPLKGLESLGAAGKAISSQQRQNIEALAGAGDRAGAGKALLAGLKERFGGDAIAEASGAAGAVERFADSLDLLREKAVLTQDENAALTQSVKLLAGGVELAAEGVEKFLGPESAAFVEGRISRITKEIERLQKAVDGDEDTFALVNKGRINKLQQDLEEQERLLKLLRQREDQLNAIGGEAAPDLPPPLLKPERALPPIPSRRPEVIGAQKELQKAVEDTTQALGDQRAAFEALERAGGNVITGTAGDDRLAGFAAADGLEAQVTLLDQVGEAQGRLNDQVAAGGQVIDELGDKGGFAGLLPAPDLLDQAAAGLESFAGTAEQRFSETADRLQDGLGETILDIFNGSSPKQALRSFAAFAKASFSGLLQDLAQAGEEILAALRNPIVTRSRAVQGCLQPA